MNENTLTKLTNAQVKASLKNVNALLSTIEVCGDSVMHLADSRRALSQIIDMIIIDEEEVEK